MNDTRSYRLASADPKSEHKRQPSYGESEARGKSRAGDLTKEDIDWSNAETMSMPKKTLISIRLDDDIIEFFKQAGSGYQTRINAVLRHFMEYQRSKKSGNLE